MQNTNGSNARSVLFLVAGAKGAVGSTLAVAIRTLFDRPEIVRPYLTTDDRFPFSEAVQNLQFAGWDSKKHSLSASIADHGVLEESLWRPYQSDLNQMPILNAPDDPKLEARVEIIMEDILAFQKQYPDTLPVLINLLPAADCSGLDTCKDLSQVINQIEPDRVPDISYILAAIRSGVPVANFTPNKLEIDPVVDEATRQGVPVAGRDGKTGQTYFKVVLASAFKARNLKVDGWYSLNILGNADGKNLMDPERAEGKLANKTRLLDDILGYSVGKGYNSPSHKVHIDYYPPRGDAKEAWDVIDLNGIFGLPMSVRVNLQGRDSILAAPLALDLGRWMVILRQAGRSGLIPELAFYFKKPAGNSPPLTFQDQARMLDELESHCTEQIRKPDNKD